MPGGYRCQRREARNQHAVGPGERVDQTLTEGPSGSRLCSGPNLALWSGRGRTMEQSLLHTIVVKESLLPHHSLPSVSPSENPLFITGCTFVVRPPVQLEGGAGLCPPWMQPGPRMEQGQALNMEV